MTLTAMSISRPAITKLLIGAVLMLGLLSLFVVAAAQEAAAGGDAKVTVNSTANIHDGTDDTGDCDTSPDSGTCTLGQAINTVNAGDADIINFHPPVFSKEQPGVIDLCEAEGAGLPPDITRDVIIDSSNTGVVLDGGLDDEDCANPGNFGLYAYDFSNGFDFTLLGGKNFWVRNMEHGSGGIIIDGDSADPESLGTIEITGVIIENVEGEAIHIIGTNAESISITNSEIEATREDAISIEIDACSDVDLDCKLSDSVVDISGNRIAGGADGCCSDGVNIDYEGRINDGVKVTLGVNQNEVINASLVGVRIHYSGCGMGDINAHVEENEEINGGEGDGVRIDISAEDCEKAPSCAGSTCIEVTPGETSDSLEVLVTVNGNGDIENHDSTNEGVDIDVDICCEESDSTVTVEVNDNGRITGEFDGVDVRTSVCCGDDNSSDISVNGNDEITGESNDGINARGWAGSSDRASFTPAGTIAGPSPTPPTGFDSDDNVCTITIDGNNEIDGVGAWGLDLGCYAGTWGSAGEFDLPILWAGNGVPLSSGDQNAATIAVSNNNDIDGDNDGVLAIAASGSTDGEGDENVSTITIDANGEITGDTGSGVEARALAGSQADEGDDNNTSISITGNAEVGGNGGDGLSLTSLSGGITEGSENNHTLVLVDSNGAIEGAGDGESDEGDDGGDGIDVDTMVCCDEANTNTITITNNTDEITGHDGDGIDIGGFSPFGLSGFGGLCCSTNIITVMDNADNIRGGDDDGLELNICVEYDTLDPNQALAMAFPEDDCMSHSVTMLTVTNNSFSDSEDDGIDICCGEFQLLDDDIKSVVSNNVIEGNGDDGIDIESSSGLNIGPGNEIFENGTDAGDNGVEIDWCLGTNTWVESTETAKVPANSNTITQNSIYDNFGLGIDLVGWDPAGADGNFPCQFSTPLDNKSTVGCLLYPSTAISPNDCLPFPDLETQSGDKLIGTACSECTVEVFWADDDPDNNSGHGEGAEYIVSGEADVDGDFSIELPCDLGAGDLTATSTDKLKNTSEFAENLSTLGTGSCATDTLVPTDTPDAPPEPTATPEPAKTCGDVNMDGSVNSVDATLILQLKAGLISSVPNESSADVDNDGNVTSIDASLILQATAGLIDESALDCG